MKIKDIFKRRIPMAITKSKQGNSIYLQLIQEYTDRSRKEIQTWRRAIDDAEDIENPRWYALQDLYDELIIDAHLSSVVGIRKSSTLNHRFYVIDKNTGEQLDEQTDFLNHKWFYDFMETALDAIVRKYSLVEFFREGETVRFDVIPRRNVCPSSKRVYIEVANDKFIDYSTFKNVIEITHTSTKFGLLNDVAPNVIWKRNLMQSNAEFSERFGIPLITATTSNKADVPRINERLKTLGESGSGVLPNGTEIQIHDLANAGNPAAVYLQPIDFHDKQVSKRLLGSTTIVDEGANRAQTQVHENTLDDKISLDDKRMVMFTVNDLLFPVLQNLGFSFDNSKMKFQFDETEALTLAEQWRITNEALLHFDMDMDEIKKTFNLPITERKISNGGFAENFQ